MRGVNTVVLVGNLGNDPDVKYTGGGMAICTLSLATTSVRKDKDGQQVEKTEWHRVKLFGKLGEIAGEYLKKGRQVYIQGRIEYGSFEKDGVKHYTTDIIGDEMQMLGSGDNQRDNQRDDERSSGGNRGERNDGQRGGGSGGNGGYQRSDNQRGNGNGSRPPNSAAPRSQPPPQGSQSNDPRGEDIPW